MCRKRGKLLALARVPQFNATSAITRGNRSPVWRKRHALDPLLMALECDTLFAGVKVADLRRDGYWGGNAAPAEIGGSLGITTDNGTCPSGDDTWGRMLDRRLFGLNDTNNSGATANYSS